MNLIEYLESKKIDKTVFKIFAFIYEPFKEAGRGSDILPDKEKKIGSYILIGYLFLFILMFISFFIDFKIKF